MFHVNKREGGKFVDSDEMAFWLTISEMMEKKSWKRGRRKIARNKDNMH